MKSVLMVSGFAPRVKLPADVLSIVPPLITKAPGVALPKAWALLIFNWPAFSVKPPVKVFVPERVGRPVPFLVIPNPVPVIGLSMVKDPVPLWSISRSLPRIKLPLESPIV